MNVRIKKLDVDAKTPTYASDGAGCFDLYALHRAGVNEFRPQIIDTGIAFEIPPGYAMFVFSRSGHGFNHDVRLANCVGVIDSDYRGSVKVKLTADPGSGLFVEPGDRIAQAAILPVPNIHFEEVGALSETARGANGFGSTGCG